MGVFEDYLFELQEIKWAKGLKKVGNQLNKTPQNVKRGQRSAARR